MIDIPFENDPESGFHRDPVDLSGLRRLSLLRSPTGRERYLREWDAHVDLLANRGFSELVALEGYLVRIICLLEKRLASSGERKKWMIEESPFVKDDEKTLQKVTIKLDALRRVMWTFVTTGTVLKTAAMTPDEREAVVLYGETLVRYVLAALKVIADGEYKGVVAFWKKIAFKANRNHKYHAVRKLFVEKGLYNTTMSLEDHVSSIKQFAKESGLTG